MKTRLLAASLALLLSACATGPQIDTTFVSQNQDSRAQFLVLHYTVIDFEKSLRVLTTGGQVSSHYLVRDEPPTIYRLVDETRRSWHAGQSSWTGHTNLNAGSIGIEIVNAGWVDSPNGKVYAPFPQKQIDAVIALCKDIVKRHNIRPERVIGHADIAPGRKQDPGPMFPWKQLADAGVIPWPDEAKLEAKRQEYAAKELPSAEWFQERLNKVGYAVPRNGELDRGTQDVIATFQMKYRPSNYAGQPDSETAALLDVITSPGGMTLKGEGDQPARPYTSRW
ncbi:N-acetylmuramoyl-L-alanine amidase [Pelomonas sp. SE-A7]|uniref:N-acetylmuramoyl-L-alanine amidase n=1 Tax=Pelomonas sp. SE-A7 TaxID=3054953 RepID=UPI00259CD17F|nr:N-acetylmuramoyl-L-alanine amidase [Pelomonas sp. SE-A7]MDM4768164.1 N-acetylmuramoyl-L-alanine amidase [Pelomonas sp. SE-A7]